MNKFGVRFLVTRSVRANRERANFIYQFVFNRPLLPSRPRFFLISAEETTLKVTFNDLATDTARTPVAASRLKKLLGKIPPLAGTVLLKILETVASDGAKKYLGLWKERPRKRLISTR